LPILEPKVTPKRERELIQYTNKLINTYMKRIGLKIGFENKGQRVFSVVIEFQDNNIQR
jgi:hypothetical protein